MGTSMRLKQMLQRLKQLKNHFLPKKLSPTGRYSLEQHDLVRAYTLLAHAEIESYLEDVCVNKVNDCFNKWLSGKHTRVITEILAYSDIERGMPTAQQISSGNAVLAKDRIFKAKNNYNIYLKSKNHGIKEEHLQAILIPIGIDLFSLDPVWLNTLTSFGKIRGAVAHTSSYRLQNLLDPASEEAKVNQIIVGLVALDEQIKKLK
jgi:RiboL-PSP-HEPN